MKKIFFEYTMQIETKHNFVKNSYDFIIENVFLLTKHIFSFNN